MKLKVYEKTFTVSPAAAQRLMQIGAIYLSTVRTDKYEQAPELEELKAALSKAKADLKAKRDREWRAERPWSDLLD